MCEPSAAVVPSVRCGQIKSKPPMTLTLTLEPLLHVDTLKHVLEEVELGR